MVASFTCVVNSELWSGWLSGSTGFVEKVQAPHAGVDVCVCLCMCSMYLCVHMYSMWVCLTPRWGFGLQNQRRTRTRSNAFSWPRRSPGACWDESLDVAGRVSSGGRSSWSTCHTSDSWSAFRLCACDSDGWARPIGRTSCRSLPRYTQRGAHLRETHPVFVFVHLQLIVLTNPNHSFLATKSIMSSCYICTFSFLLKRKQTKSWLFFVKSIIGPTLSLLCVNKYLLFLILILQNIKKSKWLKKVSCGTCFAFTQVWEYEKHRDQQTTQRTWRLYSA